MDDVVLYCTVYCTNLGEYRYVNMDFIKEITFVQSRGYGVL